MLASGWEGFWECRNSEQGGFGDREGTQGQAEPLFTRCPWQVGWTHINLVKKLSESASRVSLVLKKVPLSLPGSPLPPGQQVSIPSAPSARLGDSQVSALWEVIPKCGDAR